MQNTTTPVGIYVRLSQDRAGDGLGVARQEQECRELVARMPGHEVRRVFVDNDVSASNGKPRPQYRAMLDTVRRGEIKAVVCWHTDRLHRSPLELEEYIDLGAPTYTVKAGALDLATPAGRAMARQLGVFAKFEVEQKSERQKSKNLQWARSGALPAGGAVPFGYNDDRRTVHPERGQMIRDAYRALLAGESLGSVIRTWNASGHPAPRGGAWTYSTVRGVLLRPLNAGLVFYDGAVLPDVKPLWEPLVSQEDYYALKALLGAPERRTTTGRAKRHLLAGLVACDNCGKPMKSGSVRSRGRRSDLYRCGNPACPGPLAVAREPLNDLVVERFLTERGHLPVLKEIVADRGPTLAQVQNSIHGVTARLAEDGADVEALMERLAELKAERRALAEDTGEVLWISEESVADGWERAESIEAKQEILRGHLDRLSVAPRGRTSHRFDPERVTLTWTYYPAGGYLPDGTALTPANPKPGEKGTIGQIFIRVGGSKKVTAR